MSDAIRSDQIQSRYAAFRSGRLRSEFGRCRLGARSAVTTSKGAEICEHGGAASGHHPLASEQVQQHQAITVLCGSSVNRHGGVGRIAEQRLMVTFSKLSEESGLFPILRHQPQFSVRYSVLLDSFLPVHYLRVKAHS
jgi:hypothetical protein